MSETIDLAEVGEVAIEALKGRFSSWPLHEPAPSASELETAFQSQKHLYYTLFFFHF